jgi:SAM-dependent methyltransferase
MNMNQGKISREFVKFRVRADRPEFIARRFSQYLTGNVLDIGCDQAVIKGILGAERYSGVGLTKESDIKLNLERVERFPFEDKSYDTVLCLDTLEHLNNLHALCSELFRITARHLIISLPNCWSQARRSIAKGSGSIWHYGLTPEPPPDRHKWFFNTEDACNFLQAQMQRTERRVELLELVVLENRRPLINRMWRRVKHPSRRTYLNLYPQTIVAVYRVI